MPLQDSKGPSYIRPTKIYIDSGDREEGSDGPYNYTIKLKDELQYVVGCELTGYNFPSALAPTFVKDGPGFFGTNLVDFELSDGVTTTTFVLSFPEKNYSYDNVPIPYLSYNGIFQQLLNKTIENDPVFGVGNPSEVRFLVQVDPEERTNVVVNPVAGVPTTVNFLFGTGVNAKNSSFVPMGFNQADTGASADILSPNPTNLTPFRYIDLFIEEFEELKPVSRIFMTDNLYYGTTRNDLNVTRTRLLNSGPPRRLKYLNIRMELEGGVVPPSITGLNHDLILTIFSVSNEEVIPNWVNQSFVL